MKIYTNHGQRVFAYCHDSVGIGHLSRTLTICGGITSAYGSATCLVATGTPYAPLFGPVPRVDYVKLPALAKTSDRTYGGKFLDVSPDEVINCRRAMLQAAIKHFEPGVFLIDKAPLGVCRELVESIRWVRRYRPETRIVFGMRDVEDASEKTIAQWNRLGVAPMLESCFDEIWVYGSRDVFDVVSEYRLSDRIAEKTRFIGYVARPTCGHASPEASARPTVLVTVGGGTDGEYLLDTYLQHAASAVTAIGGQSLVVGGPDLPAETSQRLQEKARRVRGVAWEDFEPCVSCRIREASLVVTMGGYNTMVAIAQEHKRSLVVPRTEPRMEQLIRAALWQSRGAVRMADPRDLTPEGLAGEVVSMLGETDRPTTHTLDLGGLDRIIERFGVLHQKEGDRANSVCVH